MAQQIPLFAGAMRIMGKNGLLIALILAHFVAAVIVGTTTGIPFDPGMTGMLGMLFTILLPNFLVLMVFWRLGKMAIYEKPKSPIKHFIGDMRGTLTDMPRLMNGLLSLMLMSMFMITFSYFKSIVPYLNPFAWDTAFADLDRTLHFGYDPYVLLIPVFGSPIATTILNASYHLWFFLVYFLVFLACFAKNDKGSGVTFLVAFVLTFAIGGNALATVLSSAGPVYYERLGYGADFAPLMDMLTKFHEISPVWALDVHETLWESHNSGGPISGISAMPSMHVASSTLLAVYGFRFSRWAGIALTIFAVSIMIGSVHLGWHYAVDGYIGAALALLCWRVADYLTTKFQTA